MYSDISRIYRHIGRQIRRCRLKMGMTQAQLAEAAGELRTSITNIEAGRQKSPLHVLYSLCAALHIEITEILPPVAEFVDQSAKPVRIDSINRDVPPRAAAFLHKLLEEEGE